jgi:hypothetical protein
MTCSSTQIDLFNEKNNSLNQIYEQIKIIFTNTLNKSYLYIPLNYTLLSDEF